ncbi:MAG: ribose 5-phosphate isomerase B [Anaerolineales bacterium]
MKILLGSDGFGFELKENVKDYLQDLGHTVVDVGVESSDQPDLYPDIANALAVRIADGESDRGILICGTGIGMAMVANKVPGVRAACAHDPYSAERARKSNDAQIITFGAQVVGATLVHVLLDHWLSSEFAGGRSLPKVNRIKELDDQYRRDTTSS